MFQRLQREEWQELRLEHLTTQVLKFGNKNLMILNVIFGHLDALFMKWLL